MKYPNNLNYFKMNELEDKYNQAVVKWLVNNKKTNVSEHIIDIITSVIMTRTKAKIGGDFAQAVVNNDLKGSITKADEEVLENLPLIVKANLNIDIF